MAILSRHTSEGWYPAPFSCHSHENRNPVQSRHSRENGNPVQSRHSHENGNPVPFLENQMPFTFSTSKEVF